MNTQASLPEPEKAPRAARKLSPLGSPESMSQALRCSGSNHPWSPVRPPRAIARFPAGFLSGRRRGTRMPSPVRRETRPHVLPIPPLGHTAYGHGPRLRLATIVGSLTLICSRWHFERHHRTQPSTTGTLPLIFRWLRAVPDKTDPQGLQRHSWGQFPQHRHVPPPSVRQLGPCAGTFRKHRRR